MTRCIAALIVNMTCNNKEFNSKSSVPDLHALAYVHSKDTPLGFGEPREWRLKQSAGSQDLGANMSMHLDQEYFI